MGRDWRRHRALDGRPRVACRHLFNTFSVSFRFLSRRSSWVPTRWTACAGGDSPLPPSALEQLQDKSLGAEEQLLLNVPKWCGCGLMLWQHRPISDGHHCGHHCGHHVHRCRLERLESRKVGRVGDASRLSQRALRRHASHQRPLARCLLRHEGHATPSAALRATWRKAPHLFT